VLIYHAATANNKNNILDQLEADKGIVITSYGTLKANHKQLLSRKWDYVILDEGHQIRNPDAEVC
jgi:DNA excision repair protein ERCC-6